jgi:hypothetical protein
VLGEREIEEIRKRADAIVTEAVEFADNSPEPPLESLYENLYLVSETMGWYAVDERSPEPHRGELEHEAGEAARRLAEAGAAHAGAPSGPRPNPAREGDATEGTPPRIDDDGED